jgi:hypothetical protein
MLVTRQRDEMRRTRTRGVVTFALALALDVYLALTETSWWWWLAAGLFVGLLTLTLTEPARMERRLAVLSFTRLEGS